MNSLSVIAREARQSSLLFSLDCRVAALLAMTVATAACSKIEAWRHPEVAACEEFAKAKLKAPATYKRAKASTIDEQISLAAWDAMTSELMGKLATHSVFRDANKRNQISGGVRSVLLEYDAENSFGTPLRGTEVCKFLMNSFADGSFQTKPSADQAVLSRMMWQLNGEGKPEPMCCLDDREVRAINAAATKKAER